MISKMNFSLTDLSPSTVDFYRYILEEQSKQHSNMANQIEIPNSVEVLKSVLKQFAELQKSDQFCTILKILDLTVRHSPPSVTEISIFVQDLIRNCTLNEGDQLNSLQIIYQILISLPNEYPIELHRINFELNNISAKGAKLQNKLALCRALLIEKFQCNGLLDIVWNQILVDKTYYLLVHYIDALITKKTIFSLSEFWLLIEILFSSESRDDRKLGIFLVRKYIKQSSIDGSDDNLTSWCTYLTILENLEEKQSHLILPSLRTLPNLTLNRFWISILLRQILKHTNTLVLRWTVNYLLDDLEIVLSSGILSNFFLATNNAWLYNENFLYKFHYLHADHQKNFLDEFGNVSWKSIPMNAWLKQMSSFNWSDVSSKTIIKISSRLRQLQNRQLRTECRKQFIAIFKSDVRNMSLNDYITFLDALYSSTDLLSEELLQLLMEKIQHDPKPYISFNLFSILLNQESCQSWEETLIEAFDNLPAKEHQWLGVLMFFGFADLEKAQTFCVKHYGISLNSKKLVAGKCNFLEECMDEYVEMLSWDDISRAVIRKATVDWFSGQAECVNKDNFEKLLDSGGVTTFKNIINPYKMKFEPNSGTLKRFISELKTLIKKVVDFEDIIPPLIESAYKYDSSFIYKYANEILDIDETNNLLAYSTLNATLKLCDFKNEEARKLLIRGLLFGEPLSGDLRLESEYIAKEELSQQCERESSHEVRRLCLGFLSNIDSDSIEFLMKNLIDKSKKLTLKKPRYFENSKHHRLKLRIAQALARINQIATVWDDFYLRAILEENNQANVTYIYELLVASTISETYLIQHLDVLTSLSASCQVSIFAVSYMFTVCRPCSETFVRRLIEYLMPWTMGANFNTRLFAQITILRILQNVKLSSFDYLKTAILSSLNESPNAIEKLNTDVRYNFPIELNSLNTDPIVYVTIVPEDEHPSSCFKYLSGFRSLQAARLLNLAKRNCNKNIENEIVQIPIIEDVQRKMNPEMLIYDKQTPTTAVVKSEMIVVASLIDKLPNLGGIARTCEVLGIQNLILDSAKHIQNRDFTNLSMTAEKWIQIAEVKPSGLREFLIQKKGEGYSIIGAEQTANSINFTEFLFPKKCVLLLGHEKEGIPVDLIAQLDFAVEIPQFGMVRSLNVHVTGALFMYEYCKQHLVRNKSL